MSNFYYTIQYPSIAISIKIKSDKKLSLYSYKLI